MSLLSQAFAEANVVLVDGHQVNQHWPNRQDGNTLLHVLASGALYAFFDTEAQINGEPVEALDILGGGVHQLEFYSIQPLVLTAPTDAPVVTQGHTTPSNEFTFSFLCKYFKIGQADGKCVGGVEPLQFLDFLAANEIKFPLEGSPFWGFNTDANWYKLRYVGSDLVNARRTRTDAPNSTIDTFLLQAKATYTIGTILNMANRYSLDKVNGVPILEWSVGENSSVLVKTADGVQHRLTEEYAVIFEEKRPEGGYLLWVITRDNDAVEDKTTRLEFSPRK